ncbi:MAG: polynucleotide adenylyltransferase PcnB [Gammaproteobacteria bacterium]
MIKQFLQKALQKLLGRTASSDSVVIPRKAHGISRQQISHNAMKVLYRLHRANKKAYLVGGSVRDLLLGREPKDYDVATDAKPEEVRKLFRNCRLIGRRFRLAHVHFHREIIEVATFRAHSQQPLKEQHHSGMILRDNVYGTVEEDALRRDFTINALYYDIANFSVVDFTGQGIKDLNAGLIRIIGEPAQRYKEDPIRMLRAIRFAAKLGFTIEPQSEKPISELASLLQAVPKARLFDELTKIFSCGNSESAFVLLHQQGLLETLFPEVNDCLNGENHQQVHQFLLHVFRNTDHRMNDDKPITPAFILAALMWYPLLSKQCALQAQGESFHPALEQALNTTINSHTQQLAIPRRFLTFIREVWMLQSRLEKRHPKQVIRLLHHRRFRAAYDFLLLRAQSGEPCQKEAHWWTQFIQGNKEERRNKLDDRRHKKS